MVNGRTEVGGQRSEVGGRRSVTNPDWRKLDLDFGSQRLSDSLQKMQRRIGCSPFQTRDIWLTCSDLCSKLLLNDSCCEHPPGAEVSGLQATVAQSHDAP